MQVYYLDMYYASWKFIYFNVLHFEKHSLFLHLLKLVMICQSLKVRNCALR